MAPKVWVHEKCLYHLLPSIEGKSKQKVLTLVISYLRKGFIGARKDNIAIREGRADLSESNNSFGIIMVKHGVQEQFSTNSLASADNVTGTPRWFYFHGNSYSLSVKAQLKIIQAVRGTNPLNTTLQQHWNGWYSSDTGSTRSISQIIDSICEEFHTTKVSIKKMLRYSNKVTDSIASTRSTSLLQLPEIIIALNFESF